MPAPDERACLFKQFYQNQGVLCPEILVVTGVSGFLFAAEYCAFQGVCCRLEVVLMNSDPKKTYPPKGKRIKEEKPISEAYPVIDTDLARDNVENDIPDADLQDL